MLRAAGPSSLPECRLQYVINFSVPFNAVVYSRAAFIDFSVGFDAAYQYIYQPDFFDGEVSFLDKLKSDEHFLYNL